MKIILSLRWGSNYNSATLLIWFSCISVTSLVPTVSNVFVHFVTAWISQLFHVYSYTNTPTFYALLYLPKNSPTCTYTSYSFCCTDVFSAINWDFLVVWWTYHHLILSHLIKSVIESRNKHFKLFYKMTHNVKQNVCLSRSSVAALCSNGPFPCSLSLPSCSSSSWPTSSWRCTTHHSTMGHMCIHVGGKRSACALAPPAASRSSSGPLWPSARKLEHWKKWVSAL